MKITIREAAAILGVSCQAVRDMIRRGLLPQPEVIHSHLWRLDRDAVLALAASRAGESPQGTQEASNPPEGDAPTPEPAKPVTEAPVSSQGKWCR